MRTLMFLALLAAASSCSTPEGPVEKRTHGFAQGTTFHITYWALPDFVADRGIDSILLAMDRSMSTWVPSSTISALNRGAEVPAEPDFVAVWEASVLVNQKTKGAFDPTVGGLVNLWGFGQEGHRALTKAQVDSARKFIGMEKVRRNGNRFRLLPGTKLDFNAIAQGYTVDVIAEWLEQRGIKRYMVEVGGELRTAGLNGEGVPWRIGIDKPTDEELDNRFQVIVGLSDVALATSGNYRKYWTDSVAGVKYSHTINPKTGYPVTHQLLSVSVLAPTAMEADAMATAFLVMGLDKAQRYLLSKPGLEAYLIYTDEKGEWAVWQTPGFKQRVLN